jgi:DNA helicase-2/ATP-dependent DNA helicase PcrA
MAKKYVLRKPDGPVQSSINYREHLNDQQYAVVTAGDGPLLVIAGAGSGKTHTLTYRVSWLIEQGLDAQRLLLMTFTNKAAREMLRRVGDLLRMDSRQIVGGTFHHVGNMILRKHADRIGFRPDFTILDRDDSIKLISQITSNLGYRKSYRSFPKGGVLLGIHSYAGNTERDHLDVIREKHPRLMDFSQEIIRVCFSYQERKQNLNVMDFDDLLVRWRDLLRQHDDIAQLYSERFKHVLVDEYQDTNRIQAAIVDYMAEVHGNIMVVGDDSQSIYSFRGADFENIIEFPRRYPRTTMLKLETNYRSTPEILRLANRSILANTRQFKKELVAARDSGEVPQLVVTRDDEQQSEFIGQKILELNDDGVDFKDIAILYRSHFHSLKTELELNRRGIPYQIRSGLRFFERAHIKDVTSYLRVLTNPLDEIAWKRLIPLYEGIGKVTANKIWSRIEAAEEPLAEAVGQELSSSLSRKAGIGWRRCADLIEQLMSPSLRDKPAQMIEAILAEGYEEYAELNFENYEERIEDIRQLGNFALQFESLQDFLSDLALLTNVTGEEIERGEEADLLDSVILSTVHQAKGLEWKHVFVIWLSDGKFPHQRSLGNYAEEEEERRLFYVAVTRARDGLYLTYPTVANERGAWDVVQRPSRFIGELDAMDYEEIVTVEEGGSRWSEFGYDDDGNVTSKDEDLGFYPDPIPDYD